MDAPFDMDELVGRIAQQIGQQVQTQMTELEKRIDRRLNHFATALHHRMDPLSERVETPETRSPTRLS
jgi:tetrahydromethanopterin S-methyltransferase subunit B